MKKTILSLSLLLGIAVNSQIVLLQEGFESYTDFSINNFGSWSTLDLDGLNTTGRPRNWRHHLPGLQPGQMLDNLWLFRFLIFPPVMQPTI
jgi:hypothetical protein